VLNLDLQNPYPTYKKLRLEAPICRLQPEGPWLIAAHTDAVTVLRDASRFRSSRSREPSLQEPDFLLRTRGLVGQDPPEHTRLRARIREAFAPKPMQLLSDRIRALARSQLQELAQRESFDFVGEFSKRFPLQVLSMLIGVPLEKAQDFQNWVELLVNWGAADCPFGRDEALQCAADIQNFFEAQIEQRANSEGDDLISVLSRNIDPSQRSAAADELLIFLRLLLVAGTETTTHLMGNTVLALLQQPELWSKIQKDRRRIPDLVEESLRFDSPVPSLIRWATADTLLAGVLIRENEAVMPLLASANHDESVFTNPESFDLDRLSRPHLSFGAGPHHCVGVVLARLQVRLVFEEFFELFLRVEFKNSEPIERVESFFVRGPHRLWLKATPAPLA